MPLLYPSAQGIVPIAARTGPPVTNFLGLPGPGPSLELECSCLVRVPAHSAISSFPCPPVRTKVPCRLVPIGWCGRVTASALVPNSPSSFPSLEEHSHTRALAAGGVAVCPGAVRRRGYACAEGRVDRKREWGGRCRVRRRGLEWPRGRGS